MSEDKREQEIREKLQGLTGAISRQEGLYLLERLERAQKERIQNPVPSCSKVGCQAINIEEFWKKEVEYIRADLSATRARLKDMEKTIEWLLDQGGWRLIYFSDGTAPPGLEIDPSRMEARIKRGEPVVGEKA